jgi:di/tricarboxylate transporter
MTFEAEAWFTIVIIGLVIAALMTNRISVDVAMVGGLTLLMVGDFIFGEVLGMNGVLSVPDAIAGFAHQAIMMIGALFVVAAGLQETGGMQIIAQRLLGRPKTILGAQLRLMAPVALLSGFMNNTPIVAMYLPIVGDWAKKLRISSSKLFMPLSFAAILGGKLTYIGTASNIVVMGLFIRLLSDPQEKQWLDSLGVTEPSSTVQFWGIAAIGVPTAVAGIVFIALTSKWLLPQRKPADPITLDARKYEVEMIVKPDSAIVGKTIEAAGLRHLPGLFLTQIERAGTVLSAVAPDQRIEANDRLAFVGVLESVVDLRKIRGLVPATDQVQKLASSGQPRMFVEAVVSHNSPLVGRTVRKSQFRTRYNAAIIAVHRNGEHINAKIGDIVLKPGDTLLLDTHAGFVDAYRNSDDFYLVSTVEDSRPIRHERAWLALGILAALIVMLTVTPISPVVAAFFCAMAMIATRCVTGTVARAAINWQVLIVIGCALGMGVALQQTGAADVIAHRILDLCARIGVSQNPHAMLFAMFILAAVFAQLITNNGAAVLMFPIMMATARELGVRPEPFVFCLMVAAGSNFMSPVAYQTNLMVYGPGRYRFMDYVKLGTPLTLLVAVIACAVAPLFFPFV